MKSPTTSIITALFLLTLTSLSQAQVSNNDYLVLQKGQVLLHKQGKINPLQEKLKLSNGFQIETNGVVTLKDGSEKELKENQKLTLDGFLVTPDGRLTSIEDHVTLHNGIVTLVKNGASQPAQGIVTLADGSRVFPRGIVVHPSGKRSRLLDGQMLKLSGSTLPANDFVLFKNGSVILQKDGSTFPLSRNRSMMMSDGSKVYGTGLIHKEDGGQVQLKEGQRFNLPGAR